MIQRRAIPWEVESLRLFDPVTTEVERPRWRSLSQDKSMVAITRRPSDKCVHLPSYVSGYVDGEGCFCVSLRPQPRNRIGWEVRPSFSVSQNSDRAELIRELPVLFGCGTIRPDRSDRTIKFEIRSLGRLIDSVLPFFERHPLQSSKQEDFETFGLICKLMLTGLHHEKRGLLFIADLASSMNTGGIRRYTTKMIDDSLR